MRRELTLKQAYELAVLKWTYIAEHNCREDDAQRANPELEGLDYGCSYCHLFADFGKDDDTENKFRCYKCPIRIPEIHEDSKLNCLTYGHPYCTWMSDKNSETAENVLNFIKERKPDV